MDAKLKPIKPSEVTNLKGKILPEAVIEAFNELIAQKFNNGRSTFTLEEARLRIQSKLGVKEFAHEYLNVEDLYREAGWKVVKETPAFDENFASHYTFSIK